MFAHRGKLLRLPPNRVWRTYPGGRTLDALAGVAAPADSHLAEDWIASTTVAQNPPEATSVASPSAPGISPVLVGHDTTPRDFAALLASDPDYFLGAPHVARFGAQPQVLVKFLDSGTRLHFQVHPTREFARRMLGAPSGKTEAYHVLAVRDSSSLLSSPSSAGREATGCIYVGFQRPPSATQLRDYIATQNLAAIEACFDRIAVKPGDTFIIPGGTPHALGAGLFLVEVQEPSDLVVRFEFERAGYVLPEASRFMGRGLDFALTVFNLAPLTASDLNVRIRCTPRRLRALGPSSHQDELVGANQTDCFRVLTTTLDQAVAKSEPSAVIGIVTRGAVTAEVGGERHVFNTFDKFFLAAGLGSVRFTPTSGGCEILECLPPAP
ncbi:MAG: class I mannose-6-phosphate isomerase [Opitutaceae bacterium]